MFERVFGKANCRSLSNGNLGKFRFKLASALTLTMISRRVIRFEDFPECFRRLLKTLACDMWPAGHYLPTLSNVASTKIWGGEDV